LQSACAMLTTASSPDRNGCKTGPADGHHGHT
jgi:hypothetical protein